MDKVASAQANFVDLLSHMTGLPRHDDFYPLGTDPVDLVSRLRFLKPSAEFRQCQQYNNMMYHVMTLIPFITTGQDYISFVYEHILQPLGMDDTVFGDDAQGKTNLSDGWYKTDLRQDLCLSEAAAGMKEPSARCLGPAKSGGKHSPSTRGLAMAGSVGILSNAHDLSIWLQTLLGDGYLPTTGKQILPRSVLIAIYTPRSVTAPGSMPGFGLSKQWPEMSTGMYGLGQWAYHYRGHKMHEGTGSVPGFRSAIVHLPDDGFGVAIVANDDTMGGLAAWVALKFRIIDELLGLDIIDWKSRMWNCALDGMRDHARIVEGTLKGNPTKLDLNRVQGVYHHAAYGTIEVCLRPDSVPHLRIATSSSSANLLQNLPFPTKNPGRPEFVIRSSSAWADYLRLTHIDGDVFKLEFIGCWEETGLVTVDTLDSWYNSNVVKFAEDEIWFGGNYWGAETGSMGTLDEKSIRDDADVVFRKVV